MESGTSDTMDSTSGTVDSTTWTHYDVQALMCVWGERRVQVQLEAAAPNETVYLEIAHRLFALGVERTGQQCREKMEELKQDYKKAKDNEGQSGADRTTWFDALDAILDRAGSSKVMESATVMLQALTDDTIRKIQDAVTAASSTDEETSSDDTTISVTPQQNRKRRQEVEVEATLKDSNTDDNFFMECDTEEFDPWRADDDDDAADVDWKFQGDEHCSDADTELDSGDEWRPSREDIGSRSNSPFQRSSSPFQRSPSPFQRSPSPFQRSPSPFQSDSETDIESAQPASSTRLPSVGSKNGDTRSREKQPTSRSPWKNGGGGRPDRRSLALDPTEWSEMNWQPKNIPFTATPGPINGAADLDSDQPVDFLELFLTDELLQVIVDRSNLYAEQCIKTIKTANVPYSRTNQWRALTVPELKSFLGLFFLTGLIHKPELGMYWSSDEALNTPFFGKTMSRNRFQLIWRFLHFSDSESANATDRLYKIRPILDYLLSKFREMYQPNENICIDEGMLLWRGRLAFRVYNPQKPVKCGIKSYILCDSETGYCLNMKPYCGERTALGDTIEFLLGDLVGQGYRLYMDNYYNSVATCKRLIDLNTHVCGTLRTHRGEPPSIRQATKTDLHVGETIVRHNDNVMVLAWRDKRIVRMITTFHPSAMEEVQENKKGYSDKVTLLKPSCVVAYNKSMNGVDKMDQNIVYYPFIRKSIKWTNKFVAYLFQISMFNAYTIYKAKNPMGNCKPLLPFIQSVIRSWTGAKATGDEASHSAYPLPTARVPHKDPNCRLSGKIALHELIKLPPTPKKAHATKQCRVCAKKKKRSETSFYCKTCKIPLHHGKCYTLYHSRVKYAE